MQKLAYRTPAFESGTERQTVGEGELSEDGNGSSNVKVSYKVKADCGL
jgi:hypothetical protein